MGYKRQYYAKAESLDGRDIIGFFFQSEFRANSKKNYEDAKSEYFRKHHHYVLILATWLATGLD